MNNKFKSTWEFMFKARLQCVCHDGKTCGITFFSTAHYINSASTKTAKTGAVDDDVLIVVTIL